MRDSWGGGGGEGYGEGEGGEVALSDAVVDWLMLWNAPDGRIICSNLEGAPSEGWAGEVGVSLKKSWITCYFLHIQTRLVGEEGLGGGVRGFT